MSLHLILPNLTVYRPGLGMRHSRTVVGWSEVDDEAFAGKRRFFSIPLVSTVQVVLFLFPRVIVDSDVRQSRSGFVRLLGSIAAAPSPLNARTIVVCGRFQMIRFQL